MISIVLDRVNKAEYATFESIDDMRESVNAHAKKIRESDLSAAWQSKLVRLLDYLRDESRTFLGLSWKKQRLIAEHFGLKKPDTVGIWLKKLADLGIVKVLPTKRSCSMHQTANFVQILPAETEKWGQAEAKNGEPEVNISIKTNNINNNTYSKAVPVYRQFINLLTNKLGNSKLAGRLYGVLLAKKKADNTMGILALETALNAQKEGLVRKDVVSYYSGVLDRMIQPQSKGHVREEKLPEWFVNPEIEAETDADFAADVAKFKAELAARN